MYALLLRMSTGTQWASLALGDRLARWSRLSLEFALNQGLAQAAGMISGLIYVRLMPIDQYALYAMGLSALAFLTVGSDLGLTSALSYFWNQRVKGGGALELRIAAVRRLRLVFLLLSSVVCGAFLLKTAATQNLPMATVLACGGLVVATAWLHTLTTTDLLLIRLAGKLRESYYCEGAGNITRLAAAVAMIATGMDTAIFGLFGGLFGALAIWTVLQRVGRPPANSALPIGRETWREVITYVVPMFPTMIVFMVQDPLVLWLALTFGGKAPLSETFAVGRIAAIYAVMGSFIITVVAPRLASIGNDTRLTRLTGLFLLALVLLCAAVMMVAVLAPSTLLLLIGPKYAHLDTEVALSLASASFGLLTTFLAIINRLRGWIRLEPVVAACQIVAIFILATHWSFDDSASVLGLMVTLAGLSFLGAAATNVVGMLAPRIVRAR